jgi:hypothetical protein
MPWFWGFGSIVSIGIASTCAALFASGGRSLVQSLIIAPIWLLVFGFGVECLGAALRARGEVVVDEAAIWWIIGRKPPTSIAWSDVQSVRAADLMQRLIVSDRVSGRTIRMEYQLDRFADLRAFVLAHTAASARWRPAPTATFHKSWVLVGMTVAGHAFWLTCAIAALAQGQWIPGLGFLGFLGWLVAVAMKAPLRVTVRADQVEIFYLLRRKVLPIDDILSATLADRLDRNGNSRSDVLLTTTRQGVFKFTLYSEGCLALLQALQDAIDRAAQRPRAAGT